VTPPPHPPLAEPAGEHDHRLSRITRTAQRGRKPFPVAPALDVRTNHLRGVVGDEVFDDLTGRDIDRVADREHLRELETARGADLHDVARESTALADDTHAPDRGRRAELERLASRGRVHADAVGS
jgi:hypothetical protein